MLLSSPIFLVMLLSSPIFLVCAIWHHLYNLENVKKIHGGVLLLVKLQAFSLLSCNSTKSNTPPWVFFSRFLNCTNDTTSRNTSHMFFQHSLWFYMYVCLSLYKNWIWLLMHQEELILLWCTVSGYIPFSSQNRFSHLYKWHVLRDLVLFVQFEKREKHPWRSVTFSKVAGF